MKEEEVTKEELLNIYNFLKEYERICQKYNISISGCGCCGSPFLKDYSLSDMYIVKNKLCFDAYFNNKNFNNIEELEKYINN